MADRNLIVCTSQKNWDLFCKQCEKLNPSDPVGVFRYMLHEAVLSFPDSVYHTNAEILQNHRKIPMDAWMAEVGLEGDRLYFELTPFQDRIVFVVREDKQMFQDLLRNPVQVAYPECMHKPLVWLPFTTRLAFDGQQSVDLRELTKGK